jgi:predicted nuclease with RNAse H fold
MHLGIDYGAKVAGTTRICFPDGGELKIIASSKGQDADKMVATAIQTLQPNAVWIDAPLSLPGVYRQPNLFNDYFYRECDRVTSAMSPMFLGGLTARAMRLRASFLMVPFYETYPAQLANVMHWHTVGYKKEKASIAFIRNYIADETQYIIHDTFSDFHSLDALMAWYSGWRFLQNLSIAYGIADEGIIIV